MCFAFPPPSFNSSNTSISSDDIITSLIASTEDSSIYEDIPVFTMNGISATTEIANESTYSNKAVISHTMSKWIAEYGMENTYDVVLLATSLFVMIIVTTFTLWIRRQRSLGFVRSATIHYKREVASDSNSELSKAKELNNVFSRLGTSPPLQTPELCFPDDFSPNQNIPCVRIKLLTPEEIAREEF
uniref:Uncharacterized protein n=1 Tax=Angiostrongylus cantonensis TaxID=6313 RepID=A0A0K0CZ58_ANGCA